MSDSERVERAGQDAILEPVDRPAAAGHRFGPDLACSECGVQWDAHQREPTPCAKEASTDVFMRRPMIEDASLAAEAPAVAAPAIDRGFRGS